MSKKLKDSNEKPNKTPFFFSRKSLRFLPMHVLLPATHLTIAFAITIIRKVK
jgi:hypothetical protein